jgi:ribosomal protein S18 acetylase RimI-like enzyme
MEKLTENDIIFRKLNKNDKELFVNLRIQFLMDCFDVINESEKIQIKNNLNLYFDEHINKNDFIGMIAVYNGNIVSTAYLIILDYPANPNLISGKAGTLLNVYTFPEYRRKGIVKKLLEEIIKEAKLIGINSIDLKATEDGYNLYKKIGFKDDDNYKGMILKM